MSKTSVANTGVLRDGNGKIDRDSLPVATATQYGVVKASVTGGAGQAILGDANGKYNFGDDATLDPSCLNSGVIPSGVTIPYSQVTGMPDSVSYATNSGHANTADNATRATTAGTADTATNATNAGHASTADSANTADEAGKLSTARRISVQMTVDGVQKGGYADFDGSGPITIDMGTVTTGGGNVDTSGLMPKFADSGVGHMVYISGSGGFGKDDGDTTEGGNSFSFPVNSVWYFFGTCTVSQADDNSTEYVVSRRFTISSGGTGGFQAAWQAANLAGYPSGWAVRIA